jgi:hypothetical protein
MTQRTRYFMFGSALIVAVSLCTGLVAFYNGSLPLSASAAGPTELAYIPADTAAVGYANVRGIMDSEFHQRLRQMLPSGTERQKLQDEIGVDIERDIDTVVAGLPGGTLGGRGVVVLVRGRFNNNQIELVAQQHGAQIEEYKGKRVIVMHEPAGGAGAGAEAATGGVAFVEPGLLALGEISGIKRAIDTAAANTGVMKSAEMMRFVSDIDNSSDAWIVGRFDAIAQNRSLPEEIRAHLPAVEYFSLNAHVNGGVRGTARAQARDDQAGEQLRDVVRGALAGAQLLAGQDPRLTTLTRSLQISGAGKDVAVSFTVPQEMLDMLNGLAGMHHLQSQPDVIKR